MAAVEDYCTSHHGLKAVARRHGVNVESLRRWSALYHVHGVNGIQQKRRSRNFNIIGDWDRAYDEGGVAVLSAYSSMYHIRMTKQLINEPEAKLRDDEVRTRQDLLDELNHLRMENAYLKNLTP
ncbi:MULTISPECIES: helix-turn-helix domain-containing protein [Mycetohabitans]|uniref:helix-turn-helix domain-containing protein n=1 Tax=Mycetohabitans sp. B6 TaxID=2841843 RepID=UPI0012FEF100|nr:MULTISPECIES: helix-turn-helix domain-containing protein [Mycetohabitans]MCG1047283.1 helix-turn-helix domain containing protein [Mycetohabitans sp. B6]